ncbi:Lipoate-protein ligase B [Aphelenchoides besseyi]|nr:Lipoate-protein ligase B [Aphelenchoides besseyi]
MTVRLVSENSKKDEKNQFVSIPPNLQILIRGKSQHLPTAPSRVGIQKNRFLSNTLVRLIPSCWPKIERTEKRSFTRTFQRCKNGVQNTNTRRTTLRDFSTVAKTTEMIRGIWVGRRSFAEGLRIQEELYQLVRSQQTSNKHFLCLIEHTPVYTVGLREHFYDKEKEQELRNSGADFQRIKRGGLITFHGPGQLVAYPILNLRDLRVDSRTIGVKKYVCLIEEVVIRLASEHFKIRNVSRTEDPAIGVQVRYGITSHGLALNCDTDMKWFDKIVPCGLDGKTATSLSVETNQKVTINDTIEPFIQTFEKVFESEILYINAENTSLDSHDSILALGQ